MGILSKNLLENVNLNTPHSIYLNKNINNELIENVMVQELFIFFRRRKFQYLLEDMVDFIVFKNLQKTNLLNQFSIKDLEENKFDKENSEIYHLQKWKYLFCIKFFEKMNQKEIIYEIIHYNYVHFNSYFFKELNEYIYVSLISQEYDMFYHYIDNDKYIFKKFFGKVKHEKLLENMINFVAFKNIENFNSNYYIENFKYNRQTNTKNHKKFKIQKWKYLLCNQLFSLDEEVMLREVIRYNQYYILYFLT
ncbi:hypothetical protein ACIE8Z_14745 (plasmid) [Cetobacterium somerae ATCC BAA-474]|uniref:hypothetical protein n=1 Tax=Cetobacterium somerae TaxID=188913 RepID=UPI00383B7462